MKRADWPVLRTYEDRHLRRVAMPIGGIGTGTVSLGGRGDLRDWEIMNRPAKGYTHENAFFAISVVGGSGEMRRALEGPIDPADFEGGFGATVPNHGLPRFRDCRFDAAYPLAQVHLHDPDLPLRVRLQAFNPLIPSDSDDSGLPIAVLRYLVTNTSGHDLTVAICGSLPNFVGSDGHAGAPKENANRFVSEGGLSGLVLESKGVDPGAEQWGTIALATNAEDGVSHRTAWAELSWGDTLLDFWDDLKDGVLDERKQAGSSMPIGSLCVKRSVAAGTTSEFEFLLGWHFPNRLNWDGSATIGNYYTEKFRDAWDVVVDTAPRLLELEERTVEFVKAFCDTDLPEEVKEAALFNASTLRTQTSFRTPDGLFYGWEGCGDRDGCCEGSCTHVWNYEQATAFLFGDLARSMRRVEFQHATREDGLMSFRVRLPLDRRAQEWQLAAADGQMGCLMKLYRDWKLSGDDAFLADLWPGAKRALSFAWMPNGWDADRDGLMEGCQHNTMDVEYFGPNPQMGTWYLGALRAGEEMARHMGDIAFADECRRIFESGSRKMDAELFNGAYYEHKIVPPKEEPPKGLRHDSMGARDLAHPELQLGPGCLVDQLVGQTMAEVCGLGMLLDKEHVRTTLRTLMTRNYQPRLWRHFNHLRSFALQDEAAMLMAWYPEDRRPARPFPYYNESMTGFEYTVAAHLLYEGMRDDGLKVVRSIRGRYDGLRRSPFDEAECGHHYARAMASWACVLAMTGFDYDGLSGTMRFAHGLASPTFWSTGNAWGVAKMLDGKPSVECAAGRIELHRIVVGTQTYPLEVRTALHGGQSV